MKISFIVRGETKGGDSRPLHSKDRANSEGGLSSSARAVGDPQAKWNKDQVWVETRGFQDRWDGSAGGTQKGTNQVPSFQRLQKKVREKTQRTMIHTSQEKGPLMNPNFKFRKKSKLSFQN